MNRNYFMMDVKPTGYVKGYIDLGSNTKIDVDRWNSKKNDSSYMSVFYVKNIKTNKTRILEVRRPYMITDIITACKEERDILNKVVDWN